MFRFAYPGILTLFGVLCILAGTYEIAGKRRPFGREVFPPKYAASNGRLDPRGVAEKRRQAWGDRSIARGHRRRGAHHLRIVGSSERYWVSLVRSGRHAPARWQR